MLKRHTSGFFPVLLASILIAAGTLQPATPAEAALTDLPTAWNNFTFFPVTYNGGIISDYESSSDPSRGTAAINPANTDISSCSPDGYLPGSQPSFQYAYYDSGTPTIFTDDYLALRMRLNATVLENSQVGLDSGHWYILIDIDNDGWKEFAIDIDGTVGSNRPDRVYLLYNDLPTNAVTPRSGAQRSNSDVLGGDEIALWYAAGPAATGAAQTYNHVRVLTATPTCYGGNEFWLDVQLPMSAFTVGGVQRLEPGTPARFLISTSASAVDPMQKDWMLKILSDPIFSDPWSPAVYASKTASLLEDNDSDGNVSPGDVLQYTITISNSGLLAMLGVVFNDVISDPNLQLSDHVATTRGTVTKGNAPGDTEVIVNIGTISYGENATITFRVTVLNNFMPGVYVVSNQGLVSGTNFTGVYTDDPSTPTPNDATRTPVTIPPDLHITKEGPDEANVGSYITFTGTLTNYGTMPAMNAVLVDQLPAGLTFVSSSHGAVYDPVANTVTWNLGTIDGGASVSGWLTVMVDSAIADGTVLTNTFSITWQDGSGNPYGPATATKNVTARNRPILSISKNGPTTGSPGSLLTYTGTLTNTGIFTAYNVVLVDQLPAGLTFDHSSHGAVYDPLLNTITWNLGTLAPGVSITGWLTVSVDSGVPDGTMLTDTFSLSWEDSVGNPYGPETSSVNTTIYTNPQLTITKEGPSEATVGSYITFTGTLTNVGGSTAEDVVLVDYLPPGLTYIGSSHTAVYDPVARTITWNLGSVGSGVAIPGWVEVRVDASLPNGTDLINTFSVTWKDGSGGSYGPVTATAVVIARTTPILAVSKTGPAIGSPGGNLSFTLTVTNSGGLPAQNVILADALPDKYTLVSSSPPGTVSGGVVTWSLGTLDAGATASIYLTVHVDASVANGTPLTNATAVTWQDAQGNSHGPAGASLTTTFYTTPYLLITKTGPTTANPGENCTYTITVSNQGSSDASSVVLADYIPAHMSYVSSSPPGSAAGDTVTWDLGTIAGGASKSVSITLQVDPLLTDDIVLTDIAMTTWKDSLNNDYGPASAVAQTSVTFYPVLTIAISGPATAGPCDTLTLRLRATNTNATQPAQNVVVQYILPSRSAYVSSSDSGTYADGVVVWNLGTLAAGSSREVTVTINYCVIPVGSEIIHPAGLTWQYPGGTGHGPVFDTTRTRIIPVINPEPKPPPKPVVPPKRPETPSIGTGPYGASAATRPLDQREFFPNLLVDNTTISSTLVKTGMPVTVDAVVANIGSAPGTIIVSLYVNGRVETARTVSLENGHSTPVSFTVTRDLPGEYTVSVNNVPAGIFRVEQENDTSVVLVISMACIIASILLGLVYVWRRRQANLD